MTALSHERRVLNFHTLEAAEEELTFEALLERARLSGSMLSRHMKPMVEVGVVRSRQRGAYTWLPP